MSTVRHIGHFPIVGGFTTCIEQIDPSTLPDSTRYSYPIGLTLEEAMRWYWIVGRWRADVSLTADYGGGETYSGSSISEAVRTDFASTEPLTDEKQLICGSNVVSLIWEAEIVVGDPPEPQTLYSGGALVFRAFDAPTFPVIYWAGLYYPYISLDTLLIDISIGISPQSTPPEIASEVTLLIDGHEVTLYYISGGGIPSGTITIYPIEDWPYLP